MDSREVIEAIENDSEAENVGGCVEFCVAQSGERLDVCVASQCEITRNNAQKLIENKLVSVNGKNVSKKSTVLSEGQNVKVVLPPVEVCSAVPQKIDIDVVYEDDDLLIVNKPQGMVVHPAPGNPDKTLVNALMYYCDGRLSSINGVVRPGIVHRIDKDTSGLLVVAKNDEAHNNLAKQIKEHSFKRVYKAVVIGSFKEPEGRIDLPIGRHHTNRKKMAVTQTNSKNAVTNYRTLEVYRGYSLCEFVLETGRTHQIRVHASHMGHPVAGDVLYAPLEGKNPFNLCGQCLHAQTLGIVHPKTGEYMEFNAPLPPHFEATIEMLKKNYN